MDFGVRTLEVASENDRFANSDSLYHRLSSFVSR